jgi:hypothetical protein
MLLQPFFGIIQHRRYLATERQGTWTLIHRWYGRVLIIMGIINGGLGLQLAANTPAGKIVYSVLGGIAGTTLCVMALAFEANRLTKKAKTESSA